MEKWVSAAFLLLGGALVVFLFIYQNPQQESAITPGDGAALYAQTCAACHGERGEGRSELGNPLRGRALPVSYLKEIIRRGKNRMPALPHIKGAALENVARYVNRLR